MWDDGICGIRKIKWKNNGESNVATFIHEEYSQQEVMGSWEAKDRALGEKIWG